jgi:hypothetical protein
MNLLVAFKFFNSYFHIQYRRFAHFLSFLANQADIKKSTTDSMFASLRACHIPKMTFLASPQKSLSSKRRKTPFFSAHLTRLLTPEANIEKNSTDSLKFRQFSGFSPNPKLSDIRSRILVSLIKAEGLVLNRG